jgi:hypothetical protein
MKPSFVFIGLMKYLLKTLQLVNHVLRTAVRAQDVTVLALFASLYVRFMKQSVRT